MKLGPPLLSRTLHIPCIHIFVFIFAIFCAAVVHHVHFPARGEVPSNNFHACFLKSLQVLKSEERAATDILDDKTGTARTELPLYDTKHVSCLRAALPTPGIFGPGPKVNCSPADSPTRAIQTQSATDCLRWVDRVPCPTGHPSQYKCPVRISALASRAVGV